MARDREASAVLLLRGTGTDLEVFLVDRAPELRFFGGYAAFPGGTRGPEDDAPYLSAADTKQHTGGAGASTPANRDEALQRCALRELFEETGVLLAQATASAEERRAIRRALIAGDAAPWRAFMQGIAKSLAPKDLAAAAGLQTLCRIRTPPFAPVRYDTVFFTAQLPANEQPEIERGELVGGRFWRPADALAAWRRGEILIVPPAIILLELLQGRGRAAFHVAAAEIAASYERGALHRVQFTPGVLMASLATPTLPPATTTNCMIVGQSKLFIVDPATPDPREQERLFMLLDELRAEGRELAAVLLTHHHPDHVAAAPAVSRRYGLPVRGHELTLSRAPSGARLGPPLRDGDRIDLGTAPDGKPGWHLTALFTPGHDRGHLCYFENRYGALIAGDMISTVSTIIIDPPEGDMTAYMGSLAKLGSLPIRTLYPAHGPAVRDGLALVRHYIAHREKRLSFLVDTLRERPATVEELLPSVYADVDASLHKYAARSLLAALMMLRKQGKAHEKNGRWTWGAPPK